MTRRKKAAFTRRQLCLGVAFWLSELSLGSLRPAHVFCEDAEKTNDDDDDDELYRDSCRTFARIYYNNNRDITSTYSSLKNMLTSVCKRTMRGFYTGSACFDALVLASRKKTILPKHIVKYVKQNIN